MKEYGAEYIRNITLIGHGGSGKTSLSEILLFTAGEINRIGTISEGNTTSDYTPNEIEKQISISASMLHLEWNNNKINILDTPGYSDFIGNVKAAMRVCDTGIVVLKAVEGIEVGTEHAVKFAEEYKLPLAIIVNKIDNEHSKFSEILSQAKERISHNAVVAAFPIQEGINCTSVVDVINMKLVSYGEAGSKKIDITDIPADFKSQAENFRVELIEKIAETSEELMNKYFEEGTLSAEDLEKGLKSAMVKRSLCPVFAMSATKGIGINNFLDFVAKYFPSPTDRGGEEVTLKESGSKMLLKPDDSGEPVLFIFKTISEQHVGELSLFKVYSGSVAPGMDLINYTNGKNERLGQISILNGHERKDISKLLAGDLGAVVKLKDTHTNNTLASKNLSVIVDEIAFPHPVINSAIIPKAKGDEVFALP